MTSSVRIDGRPVTDDWHRLRALQYGDGVFRTLLVHRGAVDQLPRQLEKLMNDATALELDLPSARALTAEALQATAGVESGVLKLLASRWSTGRGYAPGAREARILSLVDALPSWPEAYWQTGVRLGDSPIRLAEQRALAGIKHLNRLEQVLASRHWAEDQQEALMCDHHSRVICGTRSNLFAALGGRLVTPDLETAGVAGLTRERVIEAAARLEIPLTIEALPRPMLEQASECFLTSSLFGIWPVRELSGQAFEAPGKLTRLLMQALAHPWAGV